MNDINERFQVVYLKRKNCLKLKAEFKELNNRLLVKRIQHRKCEELLRKEYQEYASMEGLSLLSLFHRVLGNREEKLEEERKEYLKAKLRFDQSEEELLLIKNQKNELGKMIASMGDVEKMFEEVLEEKEEYLRSIGGEVATQLHEMDVTMNNIELAERETHEAIAVGKQVLYALDLVLEKLDSAEGWGTFDLLGGGLLATAAKHSELDDAKKLIAKAQFKMDSYARELKDVDVHLDADKTIDISGFDTFADYLFDGLIFVTWYRRRSKNQFTISSRYIVRLKVFRIG